MKNILIRNGIIVNEGKRFRGDLLVTGDTISAIGDDLDPGNDVYTIDASGKLLLPGVIDDQVHFREPRTDSQGGYLLRIESCSSRRGDFIHGHAQHCPEHYNLIRTQ
jgi:dihydroorotase-like cyclic amidohydrolase